MSQYDVYANPQKANIVQFPYVVDIQSDLLDVLATRLVMPMTASATNVKLPPRLYPSFQIEGGTFYAVPQLTAPMLAKQLKTPVDTLWHQSSQIISALDAVTSGI
jgi:toxin CcdB